MNVYLELHQKLTDIKKMKSEIFHVWRIGVKRRFHQCKNLSIWWSALQISWHGLDSTKPLKIVIPTSAVRIWFVFTAQTCFDSYFNQLVISASLRAILFELLTRVFFLIFSYIVACQKELKESHTNVKFSHSLRTTQKN